MGGDTWTGVAQLLHLWEVNQVNRCWTVLSFVMCVQLRGNLMRLKYCLAIIIEARTKRFIPAEQACDYKISHLLWITIGADIRTADHSGIEKHNVYDSAG